MRLVGIFLGFAAILVFAGHALAEIPDADPEDFRALYKTLEGATKSQEPPFETKTSKGHLRFLGAPGGAVFRAAGPAPTEPSVTAVAFLRKHGRVFGAVSPRSAFEVETSVTDNGRGFVGLGQTYAGIPVFGARAYVQTDTRGGVLSTLSDILRETAALDSGAMALVPSVTQERAQSEAVQWMRSEYGGTEFDVLGSALFVFAPSVVGDSGAPCLVWAFVVASPSDVQAKEVVLVDAHTLDIRLHHAVVPQARIRRIYDAANTSSDPGVLARTEGSPLSSIPDVNLAFDYLGDTYDFYFEHHGRDGLDARGGVMSAVVRFCDPYEPCPMVNAFYDDYTGRVYFGDAMVVDDIVAHELTHGVTAKASNLAYYYESGAINESFSDIWGEFVDLTNGSGDDSPARRWLLGEDSPVGAIRNMADPAQFEQPAVYGDAYWYVGDGDNGGVHINSGVGNKLCYLLTDGGVFNGYSVDAMGLEKAAAVFYRVQNVLIPSSKALPFAEKVLKASYIDYTDLGDLLVQAVTDLTYFEPERFGQDDLRSVKSAAYAVGILQFPGQPLREFRAMTINDEPVVVLTWANPVYPFFDQVFVVRNASHAPAHLYDGEVIYTGQGIWAIDDAVPMGGAYHYAAFATFSDTEPAQSRHGFVEVGSGALEVAYESFSSAFDLGYKQVLFTPVGEAGKGGYTITVNANVLALPHTTDGAQFFHMLEDDSVGWSFPEPFPIMGEYRRRCWIAENGYLSFGNLPVPRSSHLNFPSGSSMNAMARICAVFADLSNVQSGAIWGKSLPDRSVITFDKLPVYGGHFYTNTAQVELFYSGHIRITYLQVTAPELVTGVADGQGVFYDPEILFASGVLTPKVLDLSSLSDGSALLTLEPISPVTAREGTRAEFRIVAHSPGGAPAIWVEGMPKGAELTSVSPTEKVFSWLTGYDDTGTHTVVARASVGALTASQDVLLHIGNVYREPVLTEVEVTPKSPSAGDALRAAWSLYSPEDGGTHGVYIEWFRNRGFVLPLLNAEVAPGFTTNQGESWYAILTPYSVFGPEAVTGEPVVSNLVTIGPPAPGGSGGGGDAGEVKRFDVNADGLVNAVDVQLVVNGVLATGFVPTADVNRDGSKNAIDVQLVVNGVLAF